MYLHRYYESGIHNSFLDSLYNSLASRGYKDLKVNHLIVWKPSTLENNMFAFMGKEDEMSCDASLPQ